LGDALSGDLHSRNAQSMCENVDRPLHMPGAWAAAVFVRTFASRSGTYGVASVARAATEGRPRRAGRDAVSPPAGTVDASAATIGAGDASAATTGGMATAGALNVVSIGDVLMRCASTAISCVAEAGAATRVASTDDVVRATCGAEAGDALSALRSAAASDASAGDAGPVRFSVHAPVTRLRARRKQRLAFGRVVGVRRGRRLALGGRLR